MKRILLFFTVAILFFNISYAQDIAKAKSSLAAEIGNEEIANLITQNAELFPNNTQLSIALIDGDKTTFIGVKRDHDELLTTKNTDSVFEIGSISKVFTSILISKHVEAKKLSLDDKMLSFFNTSDDKASEGSKEITLNMLANHTSGLPSIPLNMLPVMMADQSNPYKAYTIELLEEFYNGEIILDNAHGTTYSYSNLGVGTLGLISAKTANLTYEELLQQNILGPLAMTNSSSILTKIDKSKLVPGLDGNGNTTSNWDFTDAVVGAGGIKSNAIDMEKFIRKNFEDDTVYNLPQQPTFTVSPELKVGLGWHISIDNETNLLWHNGGTGGYRSCMVLDKSSKKAVLVLSNVSAFGSQSANIDILCFELLKKI